MSLLFFFLPQKAKLERERERERERVKEKKERLRRRLTCRKRTMYMSTMRLTGGSASAMARQRAALS